MNNNQTTNTTPVFTNCKQLVPQNIDELSNIISTIRKGSFKEQINKIRTCTDKETRTTLKVNLPAFIPSLQSCYSRKQSDTDAERGYIGANRIVLDFDDLDKLGIKRVRNIVREDPAYIADFLSPSGNGIKVIIAVEGGGDTAKHIEAWNAVVAWCNDHDLPALDSSGKDVGRLCYVSYDPDANYTDREPIPLKPVKSEYIKLVKKTAQPSNTTTNPDINEIKTALQSIDSDNRDIWIRVGMALRSTGIADAFDLWDTWSKSSDKYNSKDTVRTWDSFNVAGISIRTLFYYAQQNGWARSHAINGAALTDMGNAERLIHSCGDDIRYCVETTTWLIWNGQYWEFNNNGGINRIAKGVIRNIYVEARQANDEALRKAISAHAHKSESKDRVNAMINMASVEAGVPTNISVLDNHPMLLNVKNGTVDLLTGELLSHHKDHMLTGHLPFNHNPEARCPKWEKFLSSVFNNDPELIGYIQRCVGYSLTGSVSEQIMFFLFGKGSNGKSTFLNVLNYLLGRHCVRISSQILTQKPDNNTNAAIASLKGARCVMTSEVEDGQQMTESLVKDLTGGDKITARQLYCNFFEFFPTHKIWQYGNHKPQIRGTDDGIWRRIHLIPFTQSFTGKAKIKDLDKQLVQEIEGILAWAVEGCLLWQKHGLEMPAAVKKASDEYRKAEDIVGHFIDECIIKDITHETKTADVHRMYRAWAINNGYEVCGKKRFTEQMAEHKFTQRHKSTGDHWIGVRINPLQQIL